MLNTADELQALPQVLRANTVASTEKKATPSTLESFFLF
jgi:hypothetical protein